MILSRTMVFFFSFKKNHSRGKCNLVIYLNVLGNGEREGRNIFFNLERNYFPFKCVMILILITLIFPLSVSVFDFHTHCFQLVCGTTPVSYTHLTLPTNREV